MTVPTIHSTAFPDNGPVRALRGRENPAWRQVRLHDPQWDIKTTDSVIPDRGPTTRMNISMMALKFTKRFNFEQGNPGAAAGESARA
ncbi:MAG: hypothetical protein WBX00_18865, partial [Isosphaeraceae bacterium]